MASFAAAAALVGLAGIVAVVAAVLLSGNGTNNQSTEVSGNGAATGDQAANTGDGIPTIGGGQVTSAPEEAIESLARRSIEVLPAGQWPSLYDSFTSEFQQRCPREQFDQAGVEAAAQLGDNLRFLRFSRLESVTIEGPSAQAVIVGEMAGPSEYQIQAVFQMEDGNWKIAPAPETRGCEAFSRLTS